MTNKHNNEKKPRKRARPGTAKAVKRRIVSRVSVTLADWKKRTDHIRDLMKAGNLESLIIRLMGRGEIGVMEKNDKNYLVHHFKQEEFTEEQRARIQAYVLSEDLAGAQSCAKGKKGVCAVQDNAGCVCYMCEERGFLRQYAPEAEYSEPQTGQQRQRVLEPFEN